MEGLFVYTKLLAHALKTRAAHIEARGFLREILTGACDGSFLLGGIWHPGGFVVIPLDMEASEPAEMLRLHLWPSCERIFQDPEWLVHNHSWQIHSRIMHGTIINEEYDVTPDDSGRHRLYEAKFSKNSPILDPTATIVSCNLRSRTRYHPNDAYEIRPNDFHDTYVDLGVLASTLVLMTNSLDLLV